MNLQIMHTMPILSVFCFLIKMKTQYDNVIAPLEFGILEDVVIVQENSMPWEPDVDVA